MPSHVSHALLAEELLASLPASVTHIQSRAGVGSLSGAVPYAILGAQGPDLFLHNHRRTPRGFRFGAILHRKGSDRLLAALARIAAARPAEDDGTPGATRTQLMAYAFGYISHVWFDRLAHPYINTRAGWRGTPDNHPDRPAMHAFLERIIDVQLLRHMHAMAIARYRFAERLPSRDEALARMVGPLAGAVGVALVSAAGDPSLETRVSNALRDAYGFYRYTDAPTDDYFVVARSAEHRGEVSSRWLSLVHPPEQMLEFDSLNLAGDVWHHPCDPHQTHGESVPDLMAQACIRTRATCEAWAALLAVLVESGAVPANDPATRRVERALLEAVGDANLNDGTTGDPPCRRTHADPLPLLDLYERIKLRFD